MFHRVNEFSTPPLDKLNQIARLTIAFGLQSEDHRPDAQIRTDFVGYFTRAGHPNAGAWLWRKRVVIKAPLLELMKRPLAEKNAILAGFDTDFDVRACFASGHFCYSDIPENESRRLVAEILQGFYDPILREQGVPENISGESAVFNRQSYLRRYILTQNLQVCPACDGQPPSVDQFAGMIREDVDHFFPKAKYPFFSIHPQNLIPICKTCNQDYKNDKDALSDAEADVADVTSLHHIFHPVFEPAIESVDVIIATDQSSQRPHLSIRPRNDDPLARARINSLNYTLGIESRWNGNLAEGRLEKPIRGYLFYSTMYERLHDTLDSDQLRGRFARIGAAMSGDIGAVPNAVAVAVFAKWLADEQSETARDKRLQLARTALNLNSPQTTQAP